MRAKFFCIIFLFLQFNFNAYSQVFSFYGVVVDSLSREGLNEVKLISKSLNTEILSNRYGIFSYTLKTETDTILFLKEEYVFKKCILYANKENLIELSGFSLLEVTVTDSSNKNLFNSQNQSTNLSIEKIEKRPIVFGEKDITRVIEELPGVQSSSGSSSGYSVRGGNSDQNQFLFDQVPIYGINHFFGFLTSINPDILKEANFYKGYIPSEFGGKLSSVLDIKGKEGSLTKTGLSLTFNPIVSKFSFDTPIVKNKLSIIITARRSFMDYFYHSLFSNIADFKSFRFYDANVRMKWKLNNTDNIVFSFFSSNDKFKDGANSKLFWENNGFSLKYSKLINKNLYLFLSLVNSKYQFKSILNESSSNYQSKINTSGIKIYFENYFSNSTKIVFGVDLNKYYIQPNAEAKINGTVVLSNNSYQPTGVSGYIDFSHDFSGKLNMKCGSRIDYFKSDVLFSKIQPRVCLNYKLAKSSQLYLGYSNTFQPIHQLTNTGIGLPSDIFVPSLSNTKPESADIYNLGYKTTFHNNKSNLNTELFYKSMSNIVEYMPGATFINLSQDPDKITYPRWQDNITQGKGKAYGLETYYELNFKRFSLDMAYTLSFSKRKFREINFNEEYYSKDDRRHKITLNLIYDIHLSNKLKKAYFSAAWNYSSPNSIPIPIGSSSTVEINPHGTYSGPTYVTQYTQFNSYRFKSYHRLDLAFKITKNSKYSKTLEFGVTNVYNRSNPIYYYLDDSDGTLRLKEKTYYPIMPYVSYSIKL